MDYEHKYLKYKKKYLNAKKLFKSFQSAQTGGNGNRNLNDWSEWADYIIVGAGGAGSVLAARLAQKLPNSKILVLELGSDNTNNDVITNPGAAALLWNNPAGPIPSPSCLDFKIVPQVKRSYTYPRGSGAGGSTNHHALVDGRGSYKIYDRIAHIVNDKTWSAKNVWKYFKKMESYNCPTDSKFHGKDGWLQITHPKVGSDLQKQFILTVNKTLNVPIREDFSADPHCVAGIGRSDQQVDKNGNRSYAFKDLLAPMLGTSNDPKEYKSNVKVLFNVLVTKVMLKPVNEQNIKYQAVGVEAFDSNDRSYAVDCTKEKSFKNTPVIKFMARKEVILCGGAINTPQLLMLSGIGPQLYTPGCSKMLLDMPGVGSDLMDHHECAITFEVDPQKHVWPAQAASLIKQIDSTGKNSEMKKLLNQYADETELRDVGTKVMFDWYSGLNAQGQLTEIINNDDPDLHVHSESGFFFDFDFMSKDPLPDGKQRMDYFGSQKDLTDLRVFHSYLIEVLKFGKTEGTIRLANNDPTAQPIIDLALYRDDEACERMARGMLMIRKIVSHPDMKKYYKLDQDGRPKEIFPGYHLDDVTKLKEYLKRWSSFGHHIAGTAKMCDTTSQTQEEAIKKGGVIDSKLRVLGVGNLRVADLSIYPAPELHGYNPSRGAYVIGEMATDIITNQ